MIFVNFYNNYVHLCNRVGKSPSKVAQEIGVAKATVNRWKNGSLPTDATAQKIADYFGITVEELHGVEMPQNEENPTAQMGSEVDEIDMEITKKLALLSPEMKEEYLNYLTYLLSKQKP